MIDVRKCVPWLGAVVSVLALAGCGGGLGSAPMRLRGREACSFLMTMVCRRHASSFWVIESFFTI